MGVNLLGYVQDEPKKRFIQDLPITLFCIRGNYDAAPDPLIYHTEKRFGGDVYVEEGYENILFAKDGEIYDFGNGSKAVVIGGAYSVDRDYRIANHLPWFRDEQLSDEIKAHVQAQLVANDWKVDYVLSHTTARKFEPIETFTMDQTGIDKSTEDWLDMIEERLVYKKWYCGHFHIEKETEKLQILSNNYVQLGNLVMSRFFTKIQL